MREGGVGDEHYVGELWDAQAKPPRAIAIAAHHFCKVAVLLPKRCSLVNLTLIDRPGRASSWVHSQSTNRTKYFCRCATRKQLGRAHFGRD